MNFVLPPKEFRCIVKCHAWTYKINVFSFFQMISFSKNIFSFQKKRLENMCEIPWMWNGDNQMLELWSFISIHSPLWCICKIVAQTRKSRHLNIKQKENTYCLSRCFCCKKKINVKMNWMATYAYSNRLADGWVFILSYVESVRRYFIYSNNFIRINSIRTFEHSVYHIPGCEFSISRTKSRQKHGAIFFPLIRTSNFGFRCFVLSFNIPCGNNILIFWDKLLQTPSYACLLFFIVTLAIGGRNGTKWMNQNTYHSFFHMNRTFFFRTCISCVVRKVSKVDYYYHKMSMKSNMHVVVVCLYIVYESCSNDNGNWFIFLKIVNILIKAWFSMLFLD